MSAGRNALGMFSPVSSSPPVRLNPEEPHNKDAPHLETSFLIDQEEVGKHTHRHTCRLCRRHIRFSTSSPTEKVAVVAATACAPAGESRHTVAAPPPTHFSHSRPLGLPACTLVLKPHCHRQSRSRVVGVFCRGLQACREVQTAKQVCSDIMLWRSSIRKSLLRIGKRKIGADRRAITRN